MKKELFIACISVLSIACSKETMTKYINPETDGRVPIVFKAPIAEFEASTKAVTEVTTVGLTSIKVSATTGSSGSESSVFANASYTKGSNYYTGNQYWPSTNQNYHFYASNSNMSLSSGYVTISPESTSTDIVCCLLDAPEYEKTNTLTLKHIFARINEVKVTASTGYTLSNVSVKITPNIPKSGTTYRLRSGAWLNTGQGSAIELSNGSAGTKSNDFLLIPGSYTLSATWTATKGNYTETFTKTSSPLTFTAGVKSNISCTMGGDASDIQFTVIVSNWESNNLTVTF